MKHTLQKFVRGLSKVGHGPEMDTKKKTQVLDGMRRSSVAIGRHGNKFGRGVV